MKPRLVVLASGGGTNCQAVLDACASGRLEATVAAVVTNNPDAGVLARAERSQVAAEVVEHNGRTTEERLAADRRLAEAIDRYEPDLLVLAGWMRLLGRDFCSRYPIVNLHPALPGEFAGVDAIRRAFDSWSRGEITRSGVMLHWVPDEAVDAGPVIAQRAVPFEDGDTVATFEQRIHETEHELIVEGIDLALREVTT